MTIESTFRDLERHCASRLIALALLEDLGDRGDLTCQVLISPTDRAAVNVVARNPGVLAGSPVGRMVFTALDPDIEWTANKSDGDPLAPGDIVATVTGPVAQLLIGERTMLNFLTHLSGIATLTRRFVDMVAGTNAAILDTRKTLPGYRVLEKYAVRCGGGVNHRLGLYDGVLIKDNHIAAWTAPVSRSLPSDRDTFQIGSRSRSTAVCPSNTIASAGAAASAWPRRSRSLKRRSRSSSESHTTWKSWLPSGSPLASL